VANLDIYKKTQGRYTRSLTFVGVMVLVLAGAYQLSEKFEAYSWSRPAYFRFGIPAGLVFALAFIMYRLVNRPKTAEFLIATENEMKKVSWSSRKEIIGSTKVVIVTTFLVAGILSAVDVFFRILFKWLLAG
jgi:preprotein translocase subunit SecE